MRKFFHIATFIALLTGAWSTGCDPVKDCHEHSYYDHEESCQKACFEGNDIVSCGRVCEHEYSNVMQFGVDACRKACDKDDERSCELLCQEVHDKNACKKACASGDHDSCWGSCYKDDTYSCGIICNQGYDNELDFACKRACDKGDNSACKILCEKRNDGDRCGALCNKGDNSACEKLQILCEKSDNKDACGALCDRGDSSACEKVCSSGSIEDSITGRFNSCSSQCRGGHDSVCKIACEKYKDIVACGILCEKGDNDACQKRNAVSAERREILRIAEANKKAEAEMCHITTWRIEFRELGINHYHYSLRNVSWQSEPINFEDGGYACLNVRAKIDKFVTDDELDRVIRLDNYDKKRITDELFKCGKDINNQKLIEVAKECDGKWF